MKIYNFILEGLRPISTNAAMDYSKYGVSKSDKYKIFEVEFELLMDKYAGDIEEIKNKFDPEKQCIDLMFHFYFPFQTKSGRIHKRKGDLTNGIKGTEDALFNLLGIDDSFVTGFRAEKIHSEEPRISIWLSILEYRSRNDIK